MPMAQSSEENSGIYQNNYQSTYTLYCGVCGFVMEFIKRIIDGPSEEPESREADDERQ